MKRDDSLWKAILEDVFDDFLLFFFKEEAELFDLEKGFVFLDKELDQLFPNEQEKSSPKFVDKLVKVFTKTGREEWVLVHIEVQGYNDKDFSKRMFTYFYRIYDRYDKPVTCIAIFTDDNKNFKPSNFNYSFLGTENNFKYNTYKVIDQQESELRNSNNPFAIVILTVLLALQKGKITEENLYSLTMALAKNLFQKEIPRKKIDAILIFLRNYVHFDNAEIIAKFDVEIDLITQKHTTLGIREFVLQKAKDEGIEIGIEKGVGIGMEKGVEIGLSKKSFETVTNLLTVTDFTTDKIANIAGVTVAFVEKVRASL